MAVVTVFPDGRIIARAAIASQYIPTGTGNQVVTFPELRKIEWVLRPSVFPTVATNSTVIAQGIAGNAVGLTINVGTNTTITGEVFAIGF